MKMRFKVEFADDSTAQVTISPLAIIGWEKWSGRRMSDMGSEGSGVGMGDMCRMTWEQLHLQGDTDEEWDDWVKRLVDIEGVDDDLPTHGDEGT